MNWMIGSFWAVFNYFRRPRNMIIGAVCLLVLIIILTRSGGGNANLSLSTVENTTVTQEVSVTGRVTSAQAVDLALERSGLVTYLPAKVGNRVVLGQVLLGLDSGELAAQLSSAKANVDAAQARYNQIAAGVRAEDRQVSQALLDSAKQSLDAAKDVAINTTRAALNAAVTGLVTMNDDQSKPYLADSLKINDLKEKALYIIYGQSGLGTVQSWYFLPIRGGLRLKLETTVKDVSSSAVIADIDETALAIEYVSQALDLFEGDIHEQAGFETLRANTATAKTSVATQRTALSTQKQTLIAAQNSVDNAQAQLDLKIAPASSFDLEIYKSQLAQAKSNYDLVRAQMSKNYLTSPIKGVVSFVDAKKGELSIAGKTVISIVSDAAYEIDANITEADIAKIKVGNVAKVTLDAYGQDVSWQAKVVQIYPSENIIEGVATYKTVLVFDSDDDRIKPGMTANLEILNEKKDNVLAVPQRALIRRDGGKYLRVLVEKNDDLLASRFAGMVVISNSKSSAVYEVPVETGLVGSDGKIEIVSGVQAGDKIVTK